MGTDSFRSRGGDRKDEQGLDQQARMWRSPDTPTTGGVRTRKKSRGKGHQVVLAEQAEQWPTPEAHFHKRGPGFAATDSHYKPHDLATAVDQWLTPDTSNGGRRKADGKRSTGLNTQVDQWPTVSRFFLPARRTLQHGPGCSCSARMLNPRFVEILQGVPAGWTDPTKPLGYRVYAHWEIRSSRLLRRLLTQYYQRTWPMKSVLKRIVTSG